MILKNTSIYEPTLKRHQENLHLCLGIFCCLFAIFSIGCGRKENTTLVRDNGHSPYLIVDLGTLGGSRSRAWSINNKGEIVGEAETPSKATHACLWENEKISDLGTYPTNFGVTPSPVDAELSLDNPTESNAVCINNHGEIVGLSDEGGIGRISSPHQAMLWHASSHKISEIGSTGLIHTHAYEVGLLHGYAYSINDNNIILGVKIYHHDILSGRSVTYDNPQYESFLVKDGKTQRLGFVAGSMSINNGNLLIGEISRGQNTYLVVQNGNFKELHILLPKHYEMVNTAVNDHAVIAGTAYQKSKVDEDPVSDLDAGGMDAGSVDPQGLDVTVDPTVAILFSKKHTHILPALPGYPSAAVRTINCHEQLVGEVQESREQSLMEPNGVIRMHATLWEKGKIKDVNTMISAPFWELQAATGVNDAGEIVGYGMYRGQQHAFLLKPRAMALM